MDGTYGRLVLEAEEALRDQTVPLCPTTDRLLGTRNYHTRFLPVVLAAFMAAFCGLQGKVRNSKNAGAPARRPNGLLEAATQSTSKWSTSTWSTSTRPTSIINMVNINTADLYNQHGQHQHSQPQHQHVQHKHDQHRRGQHQNGEPQHSQPQYGLRLLGFEEDAFLIGTSWSAACFLWMDL